MSPFAYHNRIRLESDRQLHASIRQRRSLVHAVHKTAAPFPLLAFGAGGVHLHLVVLGDHREAGELARRLEISLQLRHRYGTPFLRVHRKPVFDQRHLFSSVLYDMGQREHHQLASDPYLEATSAPDLLGARVIGARMIPLVVEHVPELRRHHLLDLYGIDDLQPAEHWDDLDALRDAALMAFALPDFDGKSAMHRRARHALASLTRGRLPAPVLARLMRCGARTVERMRQHPAPVADVRAVQLSLDLRARVDARLVAAPG